MVSAIENKESLPMPFRPMERSLELSRDATVWLRLSRFYVSNLQVFVVYVDFTHAVSIIADYNLLPIFG